MTIKLTTEYAPGLLERLASSEAGALAILLDRILYEMHEPPFKNNEGKEVPRPYWSSRIFQFNANIFCGMGLEAKARWIAPKNAPDANYADSETIMRKCRDLLYSIALGRL